jgi:hypothetical protein
MAVINISPHILIFPILSLNKCQILDQGRIFLYQQRIQ